MTAPSRATADPQNALSVAGPTVGFCDASTSTTTEYVDLSDYVDRYVTITCETANHYVCFVANDSATLDTDAASLGTENVVFPVIAVDNGGQGVPFVVPKAKPFLAYRTISSTGLLRVHPS